MTLLKMFPYPWHMKEGYDLYLLLCQIIPTARGAVFVAKRIGFSPAEFNECDAAVVVWREVLDKAAAAGRLGKLVDVILTDYPDDPSRNILVSLQSDGPAELAASPAKPNSVGFIAASGDIISEPEALLFHEDLTLPIGKVPWMIEVLNMLAAKASGVCRVRTTFAEGIQNGTGVLIGPRTILTNWHVVEHKGKMTTGIVAEFGYDDDGHDGGVASAAIQGSAENIVGDAIDDWAIIWLKEDPPPSARKISLMESASPVVGAPAFLIQHPGGGRKRVGFVRNQITDFDNQVVHYLTDTQPGSSGSPVLDERGRLVALHRAGGRPQEVAGKPPLIKNEGVLVARIRLKMRERDIPES